ncbi:MAG: hypothetical protein CMI54_02970 [Parcubacteria group bacterium]|nr:hypothetical protein [Parcubacteria group bacterium]|tara:strand:- start:21594 stop:22280 length:687 start_codon:yes stop_codon:yes gene_type:complete
MTTKDLEVVDPEVEEVEPTSKVEEAKPTEPAVKPTVRTYSQDELDKAVGKGTASIQTQATIARQEAVAAKAELEAQKAAQTKREDDIQFLEKKLDSLADERFSEDPETLKGFKNTLAMELRERKLVAKDEALKLVEAEQEGFRQAYRLGEKNLEIKKKYEVPAGVLEACTNEEQMETIAKAFPEIGETKVEPEKKPKFDSLTGTGSGATYSKDTPDETLKQAFRQKKK